MKAEELYEKEFGNADSIPKESVLRLLNNFARALKLEREKALRIHDVVGRSEQLLCPVCKSKKIEIIYKEQSFKCKECKEGWAN